MIYKAETLRGFKLQAVDGEFGSVQDFYFDDLHWTIRYLVAETGTWLAERQVLISPLALGFVSREAHHIAVNQTRQQIQDGPSLDTDKPVSRQFEESYNLYFGWPMYWDGGATWGNYPFLVQAREPMESPAKGPTWDPHLCSSHDLRGHCIQAADGEIGHVVDFVIDVENWNIRYLILDTKNWWPGKKVLVAPEWIDHLDWDQAKVFVKLTREAIRSSPEYTEGILTRDYEIGLHRHYDRPGYWDKPS